MDHLIDYLRREYNLPTDAALAERLEISPPVISKLRNRHIGLSPSIILRIHEAFDMPIAKIKQIAHGK